MPKSDKACEKFLQTAVWEIDQNFNTYFYRFRTNITLFQTVLNKAFYALLNEQRRRVGHLKIQTILPARKH